MLSRSVLPLSRQSQPHAELWKRDIDIPGRLRSNLALTRSEAGWQTPLANERWINSRRYRNFNDEQPLVYHRHVCPVKYKITSTPVPKRHRRV